MEPTRLRAIILLSMVPGLIARKIGMSRVFLPTGEAVAVTYLKVDDNQIVRTKSMDKDGYNAVVVGIGKKVTKTRKGKELTKFTKEKEFRVETLDGISVGSIVGVSLLPVESMVTLIGVSKGKGFQGVVKRYHFAGGPASHGSHFKREPGSIGMRTWPGRVHKGKRMAGRMGNDQIKLKNRAILSCDEKEGVVAVKGPVPGPNGSYVVVSLEDSSMKS